MLRELNSKLRKAMLIVGGAIVIYKLIESLRGEQLDANDGFQQQEFDDIW